MGGDSAFLLRISDSGKTGSEVLLLDLLQLLLRLRLGGLRCALREKGGDSSRRFVFLLQKDG